MASAGGAALALLVLLPVAAASDSDHKVGYPAGASHPHASRSVTSERARALGMRVGKPASCCRALPAAAAGSVRVLGSARR